MHWLIDRNIDYIKHFHKGPSVVSQELLIIFIRKLLRETHRSIIGEKLKFSIQTQSLRRQTMFKFQVWAH